MESCSALDKIICTPLPQQVEALEPELWARVRVWQQTPWTPRQHRLRSAAAFCGWWVAGTITIWQGILGWFASLFPAPWMVLPVSAAVAFIIICVIAIRNRGAVE